jgi:signal peptidase I
MKDVIVIKVAGTSMIPTIMPGQTIILQKARHIKEGQVVGVKSGKDILVHRVAGIFGFDKKRWFFHIGDNSDRWGIASINDIVGVYHTPKRRTRYPLKLRFLCLIAKYVLYVFYPFCVLTG